MTVERITNLMVSQQILANINSSQGTLDNTEEELSTGLQINEPSDDPSGASLATQLKAQISSLGNYTSNVTDGQAWTSQGLSAMSSISDQLQRAQELVIEANNGTMSASDLNATADEVNQLIAGVKSDANTQYDGQYVFSGTATSTQPYATGAVDTYAGNSDAVTREVNPGSPVTVNGNLDSVLSGSNANPGLLTTLRSIATDLSGNPPTTANLGSDLTALKNNLSSLEQVQAQVGSASSRLDLAATRIDSQQTADTTALGGVQDVNMAAAYTTYSNEQAAFTAALKAGANIVQTSLMDFLSTS